MSPTPTLLWLRRDLRLADHDALRGALARGGPVIPVYVWAPEEEAPWEPGAASRWWLHHALAALDGALRARGSRLVVRRGPTLEALRALAAETGAGAVVWSRRYEPAVVARDTAVKAALKADGLEAASFGGHLLREPWEVETKGGGPYRVFTPFWKRLLEMGPPERPRPAPETLPPVPEAVASVPLEALGLRPAIRWDAGLEATWTPGEAGAAARLEAFAAGAVTAYAEERDRMDREGTSRLSPHLSFGELSPRQAWHGVVAAVGEEAARPWLRQLAWRELGHHLLFHFPHTAEEPLDARFARFPWEDDPVGLARWQRGRTGFPIVDAGMRQLWETGWMHNRVRMIVASFLTKDLLIPWQEGARWFWDTLVDADLANNTLGWQWTAGCGADAAPFFRVFNPVRQGERFDPDGVYLRRYLPELAGLPDAALHAPWEAAPSVLRRGGVVLGETWPAPVVDHARAREAALDAWERLKEAA